MDTLQIGALAIPLVRLPGIFALGALLLGTALVSRTQPLLRSWCAEAILVGLLGARIGFVALNWPVYAAQPASILYLWEGGFMPLAGAALVLPYTFWRLRRSSEALLRAAVPLSAAGITFLLAMPAVGWLKPAPKPVPDLSLTLLDGGQESLRRQLGKPLVINLWATWCPPCRRELPMLVELADNRHGFSLLLVNQGEPRSVVRNYLQEHGLSGAAVRLDTESQASNVLDVRAYPTTLVYAADGGLVSRMAGQVSRATVLSAIARARREAD